MGKKVKRAKASHQVDGRGVTVALAGPKPRKGPAIEVTKIMFP